MFFHINLDRSFYRFVTIHACDGQTDGRTDGRTEFSSLDRVCIPCSAVKITLFLVYMYYIHPGYQTSISGKILYSNFYSTSCNQCWQRLQQTETKLCL